MIYQKPFTKLLNELQRVKRQNQELKQFSRGQTKFNRKLCSQNRKRRLANNELKNMQRDKMIELQMSKGATLQLKQLINNLRLTVEQKQKQLMDWEDQALILRTQITKQKQKGSQLQDNMKNYMRKYQLKCNEYDELFKKTYNQSKKSKITPQFNEFDDQMFGLINENCQLQKKNRSLKDLIQQYQIKIAQLKLQIKQLLQQIESKDEIIAIIRQQNTKQEHEIQKTSQTNTMTQQNQITNQFMLGKISQIQYERHTTDQPQLQKVKDNRYLAIKVEEYCKEYEHLLYSNTNIENLSQNGVALNYCQPINIKLQGKWITKIIIASQGELLFGVADARFNYVEVMRPSRNFIYYNNCTGGVIINKEGKMLQIFAHKGDLLTIQVEVQKLAKKIRFFKKQSKFYQILLPQCLIKADKLFPFIKLFRNMSVDI